MVKLTQVRLPANARPARTLRRSATVSSALVLAAGFAATSGASAFADGHMSSGRAQTLLNVNRSFTSSPVAAPEPTARKLLVGARSADTSFSTMTAKLGPVKVTRAFYTGTLPLKFAQGDVASGVKIIVSYKTRSANTASYVRSIPAGVNVELAFHHEPEGPTDYVGTPSVEGPIFVKAFDAEAATVHAANPKMRLAFIGGAYQYRGGTSSDRGIGGYFIPSTADDYYLDSYQRAKIVPAKTDLGVQNFIKELAAKHHQFNGFTEYGRGVIANGATFDATVAAARAQVIKTDATYIATLPNVDVWSYWFTTDKASNDQWRFTDSGSLKAWNTLENANQ